MNSAYLLILSTQSIIEATAHIDANQLGAVVVVDNKKRLVGIITDGDIRRAVLSGMDLKEPISVLIKKKTPLADFGSAITATPDSTDSERLEQMKHYEIRHLPIVNNENEVVDLVLLETLLATPKQNMTAVVMAGGFGKRLSPLTDNLPKPMLPIDGKPVMERLIEQLKASGIHQVQVSTHYKPELIRNHFGDGSNFGVDIEYIQEENPLGTAGVLSLLGNPTKPLLIINGDIVTGIDFAAMQAFHDEHQSMMTVAVREVTIQVPYGVVQVNGVEIIDMVEKPSTSHFINAGIYLINPEALEYVPTGGQRMDMPDLVHKLITEGKRVVSFPIHEYWLDIGQMDDYHKAQHDVAQGIVK